MIPFYSINQLTSEEKSLLKNSRVLIIGAGGLGSPVAYYLTAAGIGNLGIVDSDVVDLSNLQRQILHRTSSLGVPKVESAVKRLKKINPDVKIETFNTRLSRDNVMEIIQGFDIVVDAVDNFSARYLSNDACVIQNKPLIEAGVLRFDGQVMTILPGKGPCYRCIFPSPPPANAVPTCQETGILGAVAGVIGVVQATEVIKLILNKGNPLVGKLLIFNGLNMEFITVKASRNPDCPVCGDKPFC
ncbi:MAG: hypothetical protein PWQ82_613 [Thermosediminibacterales bacterium]|nr:hypothetical protein [Thermosediminibacterales bacterium]MDK2835539.1 hypothetical protein [Thermosediminibacterales bacterium]